MNFRGVNRNIGALTTLTLFSGIDFDIMMEQIYWHIRALISNAIPIAIPINLENIVQTARVD